MYHHTSSAPAAPSVTKKSSGQEEKEPHLVFCGIVFGSGAHLSVVTSNGALIPFLLRPHTSSSDNPDNVLTPMALLLIRPESQATTGALGHTACHWIHCTLNVGELLPAIAYRLVQLRTNRMLLSRQEQPRRSSSFSRFQQGGRCQAAAAGCRGAPGSHVEAAAMLLACFHTVWVPSIHCATTEHRGSPLHVPAYIGAHTAC